MRILRPLLSRLMVTPHSLVPPSRFRGSLYNILSDSLSINFAPSFDLLNLPIDSPVDSSDLPVIAFKLLLDVLLILRPVVNEFIDLVDELFPGNELPRQLRVEMLLLLQDGLCLLVHVVGPLVELVPHFVEVAVDSLL